MMIRRFQVVLLLCAMTGTTYGQKGQAHLLTIGDPAPPLRVVGWLKGTPVAKFEKGMSYVIEFWATWCKPCKAAMPRLSALARKYKNEVTVVGIDVFEMKSTSIKEVKAFVDSMSNNMDYNVATQDSIMAAAWFNASGETGIPKSFVVNFEGKLAWIGHPKDLEKVLPELINKTWDLKKALAKRTSDQYLAKMDDSLNYELMRFLGDAYKMEYIGKPDSALLFIDDIVANEPKLKYAPFIAFNTFTSLLKTNSHKAYEYGKLVLVTPTYSDPAYDAIIAAIEAYSDKLAISADIYRLGAEACQAQIDQFPYPELADNSNLYNKMADWYWRAKDTSRAKTAQEKAIEALKSKKNFSLKKMDEFKSRLQRYSDM